MGLSLQSEDKASPEAFSVFGGSSRACTPLLLQTRPRLDDHMSVCLHSGSPGAGWFLSARGQSSTPAPWLCASARGSVREHVSVCS